MASVLSAARFHDEDAAYAWVEARLWPNGPVCPHCGERERIAQARAARAPGVGVHKCRCCRKPFRVTVGTIFEASHIPLHMWLQAIHLMCSQQEGHQHPPAPPHARHRPEGGLVPVAPHPRGDARRRAGPDGRRRRDRRGRRDLLRQVRGSPRRASKCLPPPTKGGKVGPGQQARHRLPGRARRQRPLLPRRERRQGHRQRHRRRATSPARPGCTPTRAASTAMRCEHVAAHETVKHSAGEYVRGDVHTNSAEGYFSVFKRGMKGVYQHCAREAPAPLPRRVRFPLQPPDRARRGRRHARRGGAAGRGRQAVDLPNDSSRRAANGSKAQSYGRSEAAEAEDDPGRAIRAVHQDARELALGRRKRISSGHLPLSCVRGEAS